MNTNKKVMITTLFIALLVIAVGGLAQVSNIIKPGGGITQHPLQRQLQDIDALTEKGLDDFMLEPAQCSVYYCQAMMYKTVTIDYVSNDWNGSMTVPTQHSRDERVNIQMLSWKNNATNTLDDVQAAEDMTVQAYLDAALLPPSTQEPASNDLIDQLPAQHVTIGTRDTIGGGLQRT